VTPAVSILTATYNASAFIERTIATVIRQTSHDFEWIVVDDGSTDGTAEMIAAIEDPRVRLMRRPNGGPSAARNAGLRAIQADLVALLDHDDIWAPGRLERLVRVMRDANVGMASSNMLVGDPEAPEEARTILDNPSCEGRDLSAPATWIQNCGFSASTAVIRTQLLKAHGGWREDLWYAQDWELAVRFWLAGVQVVMLPEALGWTVTRQGQLSENVDGVFQDRQKVLRALTASTRPDVARAASLRLEREQAVHSLHEALAQLDSNPRIARLRFRETRRHGLPPTQAAVALIGALSPRVLRYARTAVRRVATVHGRE
jgi:glycosyltransferase involved in cell wall biosynthesis